MVNTQFQFSRSSQEFDRTAIEHQIMALASESPIDMGAIISKIPEGRQLLREAVWNLVSRGMLELDNELLLRAVDNSQRDNVA